MKTTAAPLKILVISYEYPPLGGSGGVACRDVSAELAKNNHVDILTSSLADMPGQETAGGVNIHRVRIPGAKTGNAASFISKLSYIPGALIRGFALVRKNRYDIINTHFALPSGVVGLILARSFNIPNLLTIHGEEIYDPTKRLSPHKNPLSRAIVRFILRRADTVISDSTDIRDRAMHYYNPGRVIEVVPAAFTPPPDVAGRRSDFRAGKNDFVIAAVGRLVKRRSINTLIQAVHEIPNTRIRLIVAGDGPERPALQELTGSLNMEGRVSFAGYVSDEIKWKLLSISDLFALPSLYEGSGMAFMEAMHMGLPVVCTDQGGQTDFLEHEKNALLVPAGDVSALRDAILRFMREKMLYDRCSISNRKKIKEFYSPAIAARYRTLFEGMIKEK